MKCILMYYHNLSNFFMSIFFFLVKICCRQILPKVPNPRIPRLFGLWPLISIVEHIRPFELHANAKCKWPSGHPASIREIRVGEEWTNRCLDSWYNPKTEKKIEIIFGTFYGLFVPLGSLWRKQHGFLDRLNRSWHNHPWTNLCMDLANKVPRSRHKHSFDSFLQ